MENYSNREEITLTLKGIIEKSIRFSNTLKEKTPYIATFLKHNTQRIRGLENSNGFSIFQ